MTRHAMIAIWAACCALATAGCGSSGENVQPAPVDAGAGDAAKDGGGDASKSDASADAAGDAKAEGGTNTSQPDASGAKIEGGADAQAD